MPVPGPAALGRGVVVRRGDPVPPAWADAEVVAVDDDVLADPAAAVTALHEAWSARRPVGVYFNRSAVAIRKFTVTPLP